MLIQNSIALDAHALDVSISILAGSNTSQLYGPPFDTTNATAIRIADAIKGQPLHTVTNKLVRLQSNLTALKAKGVLDLSLAFGPHCS